MTVVFQTGWDEFKRHYSGNQAYLDCFTENQVLSAMGKAYASGLAWGEVRAMLGAACEVGGPCVTVEQGPHQPESMRSGGFCLHVTARYRGRAFHVYLQQNSSGGLEVIDVT